MGRKAKLKQLRHSAQSSPQQETNSNPDKNEFVEQLGKQGYQLEQVERSPSVPNQRVEPQL